MKIFFWQYKDDNDIQRQWALFIINLLALIFTTNALISTARYHKKFIFQLIPLSINFLATFILLMLKLFQRGYEFDQIGYIVEIFTYFLFCYTFAIMYAKVTKTKKSKIIAKIFNILLILFIAGFLVISALVFAKVISKSCDRNIFAPGFASFVSQLVSFVPTVWYGWKILSHLLQSQNRFYDLTEGSQKENNLKTQLLSSAANSYQNYDESNQIPIKNILSSSSDQYIRQRKKQVVLVLLAYCISLIMRALLMFTAEQFQDLFDCQLVDQVYIITSDSVIGQIILVIIQLNQLLPHIMIPIALYIIPVRKKTRVNSIKFDMNDQTVQDQEYIQDQNIQKTKNDNNSNRDDKNNNKLTTSISSNGNKRSTLKNSKYIQKSIQDDQDFSAQRKQDQMIKSRLSSLVKKRMQQKEDQQNSKTKSNYIQSQNQNESMILNKIRSQEKYDEYVQKKYKQNKSKNDI